MPTLKELSNELGSDKGTTAGRTPHRYTYLYDLLFYHLREKDIYFLEIGLCRGGPELGGDINRKATSPSVEMWKRYFPNAHLTGFDISDFSHQQDEQFMFVRGDSGSDDDMRRLASARPRYDIILEDASHASYHQQMAVKHLWDKLSPGGIFIVEDLNWQTPVYEDTLPKIPITSQFFFEFFENENYIDNSLLTVDFMKRLKDETQAASFFPSFLPNVSSITKLMVLQKKI